MNTKGGILLVGVDDDSNLLGLNDDYKTLGKKQNKDGLFLRLDDLVDNALGKPDRAYIEGHIHTLNGKEILVVIADPSPHPVFLKFKNNVEFYTRGFARSTSLNVEEAFGYIVRHWGYIKNNE